jgi:hypothetical protein
MSQNHAARDPHQDPNHAFDRFATTLAGLTSVLCVMVAIAIHQNASPAISPDKAAAATIPLLASPRDLQLCGIRDLQAVTSIDIRSQVGGADAVELEQAQIELQNAREACASGRISDGLAHYNAVDSGLFRHTERPAAGAQLDRAADASASFAADHR